MNNTTAWNNLYRIDVFPGIRFLKKGFSKKKFILLTWLILGILPVIVFYLSSMLEHSLTLKKPNLGLLQDYIFLSYFIFIPAVTSLALYYFPKFPEVMEYFKNVVIKEHTTEVKNQESSPSISKEEFDTILESTEIKVLGKGKFKYLKLAFYIGGVLWAVLGAKSHWFAIDTYGGNIWSSQSYQVSFFIRTIFELGVNGFLFPFILYKYAMILYSLRDVCRTLTKKKVLRLRPIDPAKAGGLGFLGRYSLNMTLFLMPYLIPIIFYMIIHKPNIIITIGLTLYIPALVFAFLYPLSGAHEVMKEFKKRELGMLSEKFNHIYDQLISNIMPCRCGPSIPGQWLNLPL
jgi:hypothetical protein